jgi:hypothetical protein
LLLRLPCLLLLPLLWVQALLPPLLLLLRSRLLSLWL